jgi:hypothetical protein
LPYIIPVGDLDIGTRSQMRQQCDQSLFARALDIRKLAATRNELVVRDIIPNVDLVNIAGGLVTAWWITGALVANTPYIYVNAICPQDKVIAFYGVSQESVLPATALVYFRVGATGNSTRAVCNLEVLYARMESQGYLDMEVMYDPNERIFIDLLPRINAATERLMLMGRVIEPIGATVSGPAV